MIVLMSLLLGHAGRDEFLRLLRGQWFEEWLRGGNLSLSPVSFTGGRLLPYRYDYDNSFPKMFYHYMESPLQKMMASPELRDTKISYKAFGSLLLRKQKGDGLFRYESFSKALEDTNAKIGRNTQVVFPTIISIDFKVVNKDKRCTSEIYVFSNCDYPATSTQIPRLSAAVREMRA